MLKKNIKMTQKYYDDGNLLWHFECQYNDPSKNPTDWYYTVTFETKDGGILTGDAITCNYWETKNKLRISKDGSGLNFYVENFADIQNILLPLMKANKAKPYPIYKSKMSEIRKSRRSKLNKINKLDKN